MLCYLARKYINDEYEAVNSLGIFVILDLLVTILNHKLQIRSNVKLLINLRKVNPFKCDIIQVFLNIKNVKSETKHSSSSQTGV